ncbi:MAG: glycosyl transferase, partial [Flavobacteriaceae bacterium]|nr:glycosyl transferase [Flavobacteriaceae bacterium]
GYNEDMIGWGREDSELAARLINSDVFGKRMRYRGIVYHIWHPVRPKDELASKDVIQEKTISQGLKSCENGIDKYLNETIA